MEQEGKKAVTAFLSSCLLVATVKSSPGKLVSATEVVASGVEEPVRLVRARHETWLV